MLFDKIASVYLKKYLYWKWPAQGTSTVPIVSAHFRSLYESSLWQIKVGFESFADCLRVRTQVAAASCSNRKQRITIPRIINSSSIRCPARHRERSKDRSIWFIGQLIYRGRLPERCSSRWPPLALKWSVRLFVESPKQRDAVMYRDAVSTLAVYGPPLRRRFSLSPKFMDQRYTVLQTECGTVVPVKGLDLYFAMYS